MVATIVINSITTTIGATIAPTLVEPPELSGATAGVTVAVVAEVTIVEVVTPVAPV